MLATISSGFLVTAMFILSLFQIALALGAPWGAYAYGGTRVGKLPVGFRIGSVVAAVVYGFIFLGHYLAQLGLYTPIFDSSGNSVVNWVLVGFFGLAALANNITRSNLERAAWGVPTILMFIAALLVALNL